MRGRFALPHHEELTGHFKLKTALDLAPRYNITGHVGSNSGVDGNYRS